MNLLITGCCGHIGSYLVNNIYKINKIKKAFIIDNFHSTQINSLFNVHKKNNIKFYNLDLTKRNVLNRFNKIDYVIHLASMTNAAGSFNKKKKCIKIILIV
jgi:UDP-glucose 4-epimerase